MTRSVANEVPPWYPECRKRTININIFRTGDERVEVVLWGDALPDPGGDVGFRGWPDMTYMELKRSIDRLRNIWRDRVVWHLGPGNTYPYAKELDQAKDPARWDSLGRELARAGRQLFILLFESGDSGLRLAGRLLADALLSDEQIIRVHSDDLFVPWPMLYTPADPDVNLYAADAPWSSDGFWGYRHLVEHTISQTPRFDARIRPGGERLITGMMLDPRLDSDYPVPCVQPLKDFFQEHTTVILRESRAILAEHLMGRQVADQISYFCCHAAFESLEEAQLTLGDGIEIVTDDFREWLDDRTLSSSPIVFVNSCEGGKLASLFYTSFGMVLLKAGANCLLGPQIQVPPLFAKEYALAFFRRFLRGDRIGDVVQEIAREWTDTLMNPLGLAVSLYRGLDTHIDPASLQ